MDVEEFTPEELNLLALIGRMYLSALDAEPQNARLALEEILITDARAVVKKLERHLDGPRDQVRGRSDMILLLRLFDRIVLRLRYPFGKLPWRMSEIHFAPLSWTTKVGKALERRELAKWDEQAERDGYRVGWSDKG